MKNFIFFIILFFFLFLPLLEIPLKAQKYPELELDLEKLQFNQSLPFDTPFLIKVNTKRPLKKLEVGWKEKKGTDIKCEDIEIKRSWERKKGTEQIIIHMPGLRPNHIYQFCFKFYWDPSPEAIKKLKMTVKNNIKKLLSEKGRILKYKKVDDVIKDMIDKFPNLLPEEFEGIAVKIKKGSIFDKSSWEGKNRLKEEIIKREIIGDLLETQMTLEETKDELQEYFQNKSSFLGEKLTEFKDNKVLQRAGQLVNSDREKWGHLLDAAEIAIQLTMLTDNMIDGIANGIQYISNATNNPPKNDIIKFLQADSNKTDDSPEKSINSFKPGDCNDPIKNLATLSSELNSIRLLLVKLKTQSGISAKELLDLQMKLEYCQSLVKDMFDFFYHLKNELETIEEIIAKIIAKILDDIKVDIIEDVSFQGYNSEPFKTRAAWHISADLGIAWAPDLKEVLPYVGANIYFRPVNKQIPLKFLKSIARYKSTFLHRFSAVVGMTVKSLNLEGQRKNLFGNSALMFGFGYRITDAIRMSVGGLFFHGIDPNPLISDKRINASPFVSLSLDWDIKSTLGGLGKLIAGE